MFNHLLGKFIFDKINTGTELLKLVGGLEHNASTLNCLIEK